MPQHNAIFFKLTQVYNILNILKNPILRMFYCNLKLYLTALPRLPTLPFSPFSAFNPGTPGRPVAPFHNQILTETVYSFKATKLP